MWSVESLNSLAATIDWLLYTELGQALAMVLLLFYLLGWWRIFTRAGFQGPLAVLMLIPPLAFAMFAFFAFAPWPARRELSALRKVQRVVHESDRRRLLA
jgi:hypothetical protein